MLTNTTLFLTSQSQKQPFYRVCIHLTSYVTNRVQMWLRKILEDALDLFRIFYRHILQLWINLIIYCIELRFVSNVVSWTLNKFAKCVLASISLSLVWQILLINCSFYILLNPYMSFGHLQFRSPKCPFLPISWYWPVKSRTFVISPIKS